MWFWFSFNWKVFWKGLKEQIFLLQVWLPACPTSGPFIEAPPIVFEPNVPAPAGQRLVAGSSVFCGASWLIGRVCSLKCKDVGILAVGFSFPFWETPYEEFFHFSYCAFNKSFIWYDMGGKNRKKRNNILRLISKGKTLSIQ